MVWPGRHGMLYGMVYRACHDIWCGLAGMVTGMAWWASHGISHWHSLVFRA